MHTVPISDDSLPDGTHRYYCPYCKSYLKGRPGQTLVHECPDAGYTLILNGFLWVGVPDYLKQEKESKNG